MPATVTISADRSGIRKVRPLRVNTSTGSPVFTYDSVTQHVIPRYAAGFAQPTAWSTTRSIGAAGELVGTGPQCVLQGDAQTQNQATPAIVVTEDFGENQAFFGGGAVGQPTWKPAVLRPVIRDCTIAGYDNTGVPPYLATGSVLAAPAPDLWGGAFLQATGPIVENVTFFYIPGTCLYYVTGQGSRDGQFQPWDSEIAQFWGIRMIRAHRGIWLNTLDATIGDISCDGITQDYAVRISGGGTKIQGQMHLFGVAAGNCLQIDSGGSVFCGAPLYLETSQKGLVVNSARNQFAGGLYFQGCWDTAISVSGSHNRFDSFDIAGVDGAKSVSIGTGEHCRFSNGHLTAATATVPLFTVETGATAGGLVIENCFFLGVGLGSGTAFKANASIHESRITGFFQNFNIALDLTGFLGSNNYIDINTTNVSTAILPASGFGASNYVRVNGTVLT